MYSRRPRRLPISISSPRREWWSFAWALKCSVSPLIRSVRSAIWTSGDPVSPSCVLNCSIKLFLRSTASGIGASNRLVPEITPQGGFQKTFVPSTDSGHFITGGPGSKGIGSETPASRLHVLRDLGAQRVHARKAPLFPHAGHEREPNGLTVEVSREIQKISLHRQRLFSKGRPHADVDDGAAALPGHLGRARVHTRSHEDRAVGSD